MIACERCNGLGELGTDVPCGACSSSGEVCPACMVGYQNGDCDCAFCPACGERAAEFEDDQPDAICVECVVRKSVAA